MKEKQTNKFITFLIITAIITLSLSLFIRYSDTPSITGFVTGTVNVTVNITAGITLSRSVVNFTVTQPAASRDTYTAADLATAPLAACNTKFPNQTCGINVTNDGSVNINVTMQDTGTNIFKSGAFSRVLHFLFNVSVPTSARNGICPNNADSTNGFYHINNTHIRTAGFVPTINWTPVNTTSITIICGLNYTNTGYGAEVRPDVASIDFNITIPSDESGGSKGTTLEIVGVNSGLAS